MNTIIAWVGIQYMARTQGLPALCRAIMPVSFVGLMERASFLATASVMSLQRNYHSHLINHLIKINSI